MTTIKDFIEKKIAVALETPEQAKEFAKMIKPYNLKCDDGEPAHEWIMEDVERLFDVGRKLGEPEISFSYNFEEVGIKGFAWCTLVNRNDPHYTEVGWKIVPFSEFKEAKKRYFSVEKWKEQNEFTKVIAPEIFEIALKTFVADCDGAEVKNGKMKGKTGCVYDCLEDWTVDEKPVMKYQIIIECDGNDITTADFIVDGKIINSAKAKRNPEDKFDFKVGAEVAFNRLFEKCH